MKVSCNWLRELVELPPTVAALVDLLTLAGVEVEGVETRGCTIPNVVVAQIRESVQHPNADRLSVCQVDDGTGTARQIVCGAKNYQVGDKVPLALPGAKLGPDFTIKVGKLRGVESPGDDVQREGTRSRRRTRTGCSFSRRMRRLARRSRSFSRRYDARSGDHAESRGPAERRAASRGKSQR